MINALRESSIQSPVLGAVLDSMVPCVFFRKLSVIIVKQLGTRCIILKISLEAVDTLVRELALTSKISAGTFVVQTSSLF